MPQTIKNVGLYLAPRHGPRTDYNLVLGLYISDHSAGGFPDGDPIVMVQRKVNDIDHEGWYVFDFPEDIILGDGFYSLTLHQTARNQQNIPDFSVNFVDWLHSPTFVGRNVSSFSSDYGFTSDIYGYGYGGHGLGSSYGCSNVYGYGYGYGYGDGSVLDYFDVIGVNGDFTGYAYNEPSEFYGYGYGFENICLISDSTIFRNFKIYEDFNNVEFLSDNSVKINIPPATAVSIVLDNRQDFLLGEKRNTNIVNNFITLDNFGDRFLSTDLSPLDSSCSNNIEFEWFQSNFSLSGNDINYADISNPTTNTNAFSVYLTSAPIHAGIFVSINGGSSWNERNTGLTLASNKERNFSCVKFGPNGDFIIAFDNTSMTENGKVFRSFDLGTNWTQISSDLNGRVINDAYVVNSLDIWVGTDIGVYRTMDGGATWSSVGIGLPANTEIHQIVVDLDIGTVYGYGYGGGIGVDFFDVIGVDGIGMGYGYGSFESNFKNEYGFGFGFEYTSGSGSITIPIIATKFGAYILSQGTWSKIYPTDNTNVEVWSVNIANNGIFIGLNNKLLRSTEDQINGGLVFVGDNASSKDPLLGGFYVHGLLDTRVTSIKFNPNDEAEIIVGQHGGILRSKNDGGNFDYLSKGFRDKKIKQLLINPVDPKIIYAIPETTRFSSAGVTFVIDCSGSMKANDPNDKRIDLVTKVVNEINSVSTNTPYFQIIRFGISEKEVLSNEGFYSIFRNSGIEFDYEGAINLLSDPSIPDSGGGFSADVTKVLSAIETCRTGTEHSRTPLYDTLSATAKGLVKHGSRWRYQDKDNDQSFFKYRIDNTNSDFYTTLDKSVIIITDGQDTVNGKNINSLISGLSNYKEIPAEVYIIGVGHNINYDVLHSLKTNHPHSQLYLAPYEENIQDSVLTSVADIILDKEKFRTREGYWDRIVDLEEKKIIKTVFVKANVPPNTTITYQVRASDDKDIWSDWATLLAVNTTNAVNLSGKYFEIKIDLSSNFAAFAPEVRRITIGVTDTSKSFIYYPTESTTSGDRISEIELSSIDDISLGVLSDSNITTNFGIVQSQSTNFNFFNKVHRDKRSVLLRRETENLSTTDGFFFTTKLGAWPADAGVVIFDADIFETNVAAATISSTNYTLVPSLGLVIFYDKILSTTKLKINLSFIADYRLGLKITNLSDSVATYHLHDLSYMYYTESTSKFTRTALPKVLSQLTDTDTFGIVSKTNYPIGPTVSASFLAQFILRDTIQSGDIVSISTGQRLNISTTIGTNNVVFYEQNAFLTKPQESNPTDASYFRIFTNADITGLDTKTAGIVFLTDNTVSLSQIAGLHYQINTSIPGTIVAGNSITFAIGDTTQGSQGIPTYLFQSNLLFDSDNRSVGELQTNFFIGDRADGSLPDITLNTANGFDKKITPSITLSGGSGESIVLIVPSTATSNSIQNIKVIIVDSQGLIDRKFNGTVMVFFEDENFGLVLSSGTNDPLNLKFSSSDSGVKVLSASYTAPQGSVIRVFAKIIDDNATVAEVLALRNSTGAFISNTTSIVSSDKLVRWGDLNVSTMFSDGRQDVDFIVDYASRISGLDFVGVVDDLGTLSSSEWQYNISRSSALSSSTILVIPGFRHRTDNFYGERLLLFSNSIDAPNNIISRPTDFATPEAQIKEMVKNIAGSSCISIPIHSAYANDDTDPLKRGRGFIFDRYRDILEFIPNRLFDNFIKDTEVAAEVYSEHGNVEKNIFYQHENFVNTDERVYVEHALLIGKKFGFTAGSGGYHSRPGMYKGDVSSKTQLPSNLNSPNKGLTGVLLDNFTKEALFQEIKSRECYATTGARIHVEFNGESQGVTRKMGGVLSNLGFNVLENNSPKDGIKLKIRAVADNSTIARIEIIRIKIDNQIEVILDTASTTVENFNFINFGLDTGTLVFTDEGVQEDGNVIDGSIGSENVANEEYCYYARITQADGHMAWITPIWFNYGRTEGVKKSSESGLKTVFKPLLSMESGQFTSIPYFVDGAINISLPTKHNNLFLQSTASSPNINVDRFRQSYSDRRIMVSENNVLISGMRIFETDNIHVMYGTHHPLMINQLSAFVDEVKNPLSGFNGLETDGNDSNFKYLDHSSVVISPANSDKIKNRENLGKFLRSFSAGAMWQYLSTGQDFRVGPYSLESFTGDVVNSNSIYEPDVIEQAKLVMKPFVHKEGDIFYTLYSSSLVAYPENQPGSPPKILFDNRTQSTIEAEETSGLSYDNSGEIGVNWGLNMRIRVARGNGAGSRTFSLVSDQIVPNDFGGDKIHYPHSPVLKKISGSSDPFRLFFLGYYRPNNEKPKEFKLAMYCYNFNSITNVSTGTMKRCFVFSGSGTSFDSHNFVRYDSKDGTSSQAWPEDPYYAMYSNWLSVAEFDDGTFYAFFNYENLGTRISNINSPGTGILFSFDGIKFMEKAEDNLDNFIPPLESVTNVHPFKFTFNDSTSWYMLYSDSSGLVRYSKINWVSDFTTNVT